MQDQPNTTSLQETQPLVSFIIAYYDLPVTMLRQCIDSILALSLGSSEREIIVVDDGSKESPLRQLTQYLDDIVYVRQPNGGLSRARNRGIQVATGRYLQFVDADDYLLQASYEHCLDIVRYQKPDVVMFDFNDDDDEPPTADFADGDVVGGTDYLMHQNLQASACCMLISRRALGTLRFTPGISHEDEEFTPLLLLRAESVCSTEAKAYYYRHRPLSITTSTDIRSTVRRLNDKMAVICRLNRLSDTMPPSERQAMQRRVAQLTMDYIYNVIMQTRSRHYLDRKLDLLRRKGLFPLPDRDYTTKYKWFRRLTNSQAGLSLLMNVLPVIKPER